MLSNKEKERVFESLDKIDPKELDKKSKDEISQLVKLCRKVKINVGIDLRQALSSIAEDLASNWKQGECCAIFSVLIFRKSTMSIIYSRRNDVRSCVAMHKDVCSVLSSCFT